MDANLVPVRLAATLAGLFGVLGALLAVIGTYGLLAYSVARRINEIGIRMRWGLREATSPEASCGRLWQPPVPAS